MERQTEALTKISNNFPKATRTLIGLGVTGLIALTIYKLNPGDKSEVNESNIALPELPQLTLPKSRPESPQPSTPQPIQNSQTSVVEKQSQTVIVMPNSTEQFDCVKYGGGLGCFDSSYQPNYPQYYSGSNTPKNEWQQWENEQQERESKRRAFWNTYW